MERSDAGRVWCAQSERAKGIVERANEFEHRVRSRAKRTPRAASRLPSPFDWLPPCHLPASLRPWPPLLSLSFPRTRAASPSLPETLARSPLPLAKSLPRAASPPLPTHATPLPRVASPPLPPLRRRQLPPLPPLPLSFLLAFLSSPKFTQEAGNAEQSWTRKRTRDEMKARGGGRRRGGAKRGVGTRDREVRRTRAGGGQKERMKGAGRRREGRARPGAIGVTADQPRRPLRMPA